MRVHKNKTLSSSNFITSNKDLDLIYEYYAACPDNRPEQHQLTIALISEADAKHRCWRLPSLDADEYNALVEHVGEQGVDILIETVNDSTVSNEDIDLLIEHITAPRIARVFTIAYEFDRSRIEDHDYPLMYAHDWHPASEAMIIRLVREIRLNARSPKKFHVYMQHMLDMLDDTKAALVFLNTIQWRAYNAQAMLPIDSDEPGWKPYKDRFELIIALSESYTYETIENSSWTSEAPYSFAMAFDKDFDIDDVYNMPMYRRYRAFLRKHDNSRGDIERISGFVNTISDWYMNLFIWGMKNSNQEFDAKKELFTRRTLTVVNGGFISENAWDDLERGLPLTILTENIRSGDYMIRFDGLDELISGYMDAGQPNMFLEED
jgi:hypothetical protein